MTESPDARYRRLAKAKAWRESHRDLMRAYDRKYASKNKDKARARHRRWVEANKDKVVARRASMKLWNRDWQTMRKSERTGMPVLFHPSAVRSLYRGQCWACGSGDRIRIDHIIPLSRGGTNHLFNVRALCVRCNSRKSFHLDHEVPDCELRMRLLLGHEAFDAAFKRDMS